MRSFSLLIVFRRLHQQRETRFKHELKPRPTTKSIYALKDDRFLEKSPHSITRDLPLGVTAQAISQNLKLALGGTGRQRCGQVSLYNPAPKTFWEHYETGSSPALARVACH